MSHRFDGFPIFSGLAPEEIDRVLRGSEEIARLAHQPIFESRSPCDGIYVIHEGKVEIRRKDTNGGEIRVALLGRPSVFGEMSLIADRPRSASAVALENVKLTKLSKRTFDDLIAAGDLAAFKLIRSCAKIITERLKVTEEQFLIALKELGVEKRDKKLAELQQFRQKLFSEWSF
ncbi:MAG: cyclic nucleotide-binding domain-containing protein [Planctomycetota bacterium]